MDILPTGPRRFASWVLSLYNAFMSWAFESVKDKPIGLWPLGSFTDYSGYSRNASMKSGSAVSGIGLIAGVQSSYVFSSANVCQFTSPVFVQGQESKSFTLEATVLPINDGIAGEQQILGHFGKMDGLVINGTKISFVTKYLSAPESRASFDIQTQRSVNVIAVHTESKNSLYIDGALVAESAVTDEHRADKYVATDGKLYSGDTSTAASMAVNGIGIYPIALTDEQVKRHYDAATRAAGTDVVSSFGGITIPVSKNPLDIAFERTWSSEDDWKAAELQGVLVDNGILVPQEIDGLSVAGQWVDSVDIYNGDSPDTLYAVNIIWDGIGPVVEASVDDVTWEVVTRGKNLDCVPPGFDPTGKELYVRASFSGGIENDESFIDNMVVTGLRTGTVPDVHGRAIAYTQPAYLRNQHNPTEFSADWGVLLDGGSVSISDDTSGDPMLAKTVEVWLRRTTSDPVVFSSNLNAATNTYSNGTAGSSMPVGQWVVRHFVNASWFAGNLTVSGKVQIGMVAIYPDAKTATDVANIMKSYNGVLPVRVDDNSNSMVTESASPANIYAHDWALESGG